MIEAMKHYEAALLEAFPRGATGDVFEHWNNARKAIAEAEKQEPVQVTIKDFVKAVEGKEDMVGRPVYWAQWPNADTHPQPKREWVGLTAEDWENLPDTGKEGCERDAEIFDWIESTLKAKNT